MKVVLNIKIGVTSTFFFRKFFLIGAVGPFLGHFLASFGLSNDIAATALKNPDIWISI